MSRVLAATGLQSAARNDRIPYRAPRYDVRAVAGPGRSGIAAIFAASREELMIN